MEPTATVFKFISYEFNHSEKRAVFHYATEFNDRDSLIFTETINLPKAPDLKHIPKELLEKLLQSLHIILGISYYKFYCAERVNVPYRLSKKEADFWNIIYKKGLGEFFYKNSLNPKISPKFLFSQNSSPRPCTLDAKPSKKCLVGIGGGKDSIVVAELLKGWDITAFAVESSKPSPLIQKVIEIIGVGDLKIWRHLDPQVFEPHQYNGHIPVSAVYAFLGVFAAVLYGYDYIIVGNEHSSNFGNINYKSLQINHQWSKSFEFEAMFSEYVRNFLTPDVKYFSLLRSFYEIRIVKLFTKYKQYFSHFSSCNRNFRIEGKSHQGLWCGECPKCVFVWTLLSAFLPKKELIKMFGKNLYENETLLPLFKDILGLGSIKPFDCVGTFEEAETAFTMAKKKFLQSKIHPEVFKTNKETLVPDQFKFLGMETAYILGYGKEGKITKEYLKKYYPKIKIGIGDGAPDKNYLKNQTDWDIAIKTPGIKKELVTIPYTTATNIFFSQIKDKNLIIGITGSKGKSTTSSLIYHILKNTGKNVELLGNIGKPMLETLLKPVDKNKIFVLELSSYQLDDIHYSPDIAVITNLFPEHMDFHGSLKNYYEAKKNIYRFQKPGEHLIDRPKAKKHYQTQLLGQHNQNNIQAAVEVAKILKIPERKIEEAIKSFQGLPHRLQNIGTYRDITFYDDAISTTPDSTIMAIKALKNIDTIFLGGQDRGYDFSKLEKTIKKYKIKNVVLFPDSGEKILKTLRHGSEQNLRILKTSSMEKAVTFAYKYTEKGEICVLSCASPSYSLWENFEEKGDQFKFFVKKLGR